MTFVIYKGDLVRVIEPDDKKEELTHKLAGVIKIETEQGMKIVPKEELTKWEETTVMVSNDFAHDADDKFDFKKIKHKFKEKRGRW